MAAILPGISGKREIMARVILFALGMAVIMTGFGGCGYKAPPYYEKPAHTEGSTVAL